MFAMTRAFALGFVLALATRAAAHEGHDHRPGTVDVAPAPAGRDAGATTGSGRFTFRLLPVELPDAMREHLGEAHGGFAPDPEASGGDGSTWFGLRGVGLLRLTPDLARVEVVGGDFDLARSNLHNACLVRAGREPLLALPSDEAQKVFVTDRTGKIVHTFDNPYGMAEAADRPFRVCDVEYVGGRLIAVNGYADNVCFVTMPLDAALETPTGEGWDSLRFGGAGTEHGRFGTAHGITRVPATNVFTIADRANARLETLTTEGHFVAGLDLPAGTMPCDVDYLGPYALVGCLKGPGGSTPAPIYVLEEGNVVAELNIGRDLGLEGFTHIHNAAFRAVEREDGREQLFVLAYAWNPGNFAVLEQVLE